MKRSFAALVVLSFVLRAEAGGDYLGQKPPGAEPLLFAPGMVSTGLSERDIAITPDGSEIYYSAYAGSYTFAAIMVVRRSGDSWGPPEVASFSGIPGVSDLEPALSADGNRLLFLSDRPAKPGEKGGQHIWSVERSGTGWGPATPLGAPVRSEAEEYFPSLTKDGTLYFTLQSDKARPDGIYRSRLVDGKYSEPERLPGYVNSGRARYNAFVAPDESYLIYAIYGRADGLGRSDYYISFRSADDVWSEPVNLGPKINTAGDHEYSAYVTRDGRYLFFMSGRTAPAAEIFGERVTAAALQRLAAAPGNGHSDIWWVDASFLESLRPPSGTEIHAAAEAGDAAKVRSLLESGPALVRARGPRGRTPLHSAARAGHTEVMEALLAAGADVNAGDAQDSTPLHGAAFHGREAALRLLLARGATVDARDSRRNTPLLNALSRSHRSLVAPLVAAGADVNARDFFGMPPLHSAVRRGFAEEAAELLTRGAEIDATGFNGSTALHLAVENGRRGILEVLLERGAATGIRDEAGDTPLHKAAAAGDPGMVALLLARSPDLEGANRFGRTALHQAAVAGHGRVVRQLLDRGAAPGARDLEGKTPRDLALGHRHGAVAAALAPASGTPAGATSDPRLSGPGRGRVTAWYLGNSGWAVRVGKRLLVFDYWNYDAAPDHPSLASGRLVPEELKGLKVYLFTTHVHPDHYDPAILRLAEAVPDVTLIFGWDEAAAASHQRFVTRREARRLDDLEIRQISDGESSAFLVRVDGVAVFHGGDYVGGIDRGQDYRWLAEGGGAVDAAFVDIRGTYRVMRSEALRVLQPRLVFPMHAGRMEPLCEPIPGSMATDFPKARFLCARDRGDAFDLSKTSP